MIIFFPLLKVFLYFHLSVNLSDILRLQHLRWNSETPLKTANFSFNRSTGGEERHFSHIDVRHLSRIFGFHLAVAKLVKNWKLTF